MKTNEMKKNILEDGMDERFLDIYVDATKLEYHKRRYVQAIELFEAHYGAGEAEIFSAPGRSEVGGNHTDHQHGEVLAASINLDTIGIVRQTEDNQIRIISDDYDEVVISLDNIDCKEEEKETTTALIKGVVAGFMERGYKVGGFRAYATSDVLIGAGLSSSAAFETLIGTILSGLYNDMSISAIEIAIVGQYAENVYFGKPCGLMDQMACSVGSLVHINFENSQKPEVERVEFDLDVHGYSLCITDTKGSHADLTPDYAAIPMEMKQAAACFGKEVLGEVSKKEILSNLSKIRAEAGDRAALRALHFICENERVQKEVDALKKDNFLEFLLLVKRSGDSSFKYLQNVFTCHDVSHQNVSVALAVSEILLEDKGVCRVHGGGFAGTIQAFVPNELVEHYKTGMEEVFGSGACDVLKIRKYGGIKVI